MKKVAIYVLAFVLIVSTLFLYYKNEIFNIETRGESKEAFLGTKSTKPYIRSGKLIVINGILREPSFESRKTIVVLQSTHRETVVAISSPVITSIVTPSPIVSNPPTETPSSTPTTVPITPTLTPTPTPTFDYSVPWPVANGCPSTTLSCVPCTSGWACRYESGETHGFKGWSCQNNNPGNIRNSSTNMATDFKNKIITRNGGVAACGVRYDSRGGSYFVFSSYSAGMSSLKAYIKGISNGEHGSYVGCGECTIAYFFSKYAPGDPNYATYVANYIGESTTQTLNYVVANKLDSFAEAIKTHEGFFVK